MARTSHCLMLGPERLFLRVRGFPEEMIAGGALLPLGSEKSTEGQAEERTGASRLAVGAKICVGRQASIQAVEKNCAGVLMPDHAHVVAQPLWTYLLDQIGKSCKGSTGCGANKLLNGTGTSA